VCQALGCLTLLSASGAGGELCLQNDVCGSRERHEGIKFGVALVVVTPCSGGHSLTPTMHRLKATMHHIGVGNNEKYSRGRA
jgi:hypothetical protein